MVDIAKPAIMKEVTQHAWSHSSMPALTSDTFVSCIFTCNERD